MSDRGRRNALERERYRRDMEDPERKAYRNRKALAQYYRRKDDPMYRLQRQLREMTRVRIV